MSKRHVVVALAAAISLTGGTIAAAAPTVTTAVSGTAAQVTDTPGFPGIPPRPGQPGKPGGPGAGLDYPDSEFFINATDANWAAILERSKKQTVFAEFSAKWCKWCLVLKPILKKYNDEDKSWVFAYVDVQATKIAAQYNLGGGIPVTLAIRDGKVIGTMDGYDDEKSTREFINKYK